MKGFSFYITYYDVARELETDEEKGEFYLAIMDYMFANIDREAELSKTVRICFKAIKANLKTSKRKSANSTKAKTKRKRNQNDGETKSKRNGNEMQTKTQQAQAEDKDDTTYHLSAGHAASDEQRVTAVVNCPNCNALMFRNTQTGNMECPRCFTVVRKDGSVAS